MSQSLFSTVSLTILSDSGETTEEKVVKSSVAFTQKFCGDMQVNSDNTFLTLPMGGVSSSVAIRVYSDQPLSIKINGSSTIVAMSSFFAFSGAITQLQVRNNSGYVANIEYEVYG